jgi:FkbM family methyltransferase
MGAMLKPDADRTLRVWRFLRRPWNEKAVSLSYRWHLVREFWAKLMERVPIPTLLPFGVWWVAKNDHIGQPIREGRFEAAEAGFVERFVEAGMTVLDIGAHHGFYTLLCSKRVGAGGRVIAFEPSPRERKALLLHLRLNRCRNVSVEGLALSNEETTGKLYVIEGKNTGCNSLRPPVAVGEMSLLSVRVVRLDEWLRQRKVDRVDFIKLDVEGGELAVLEGAVQLLERKPRPVILAEVQDVRTQPWGYRAKEIIDHLAQRGYKWFGLLPDGSIEELDVSVSDFFGNFVAFPKEFGNVLERFGHASNFKRQAESNVRDPQTNNK